jgi:hypothetical protein
MSLRATQRELRQARRLSQLIGALVFLLGVLFFLAYFLLPGSGARSVAVESALVLANVCFSASLVAILVSRAILEEANLSARAAIQQSVDETLAPIRDTLLTDSQQEYRWHCILGMPGLQDPFQNYAIQKISIEKTVNTLPDELRFVCVASYADDVFGPYTDDRRYQLRWVIDSELDPRNVAISDVLSCRLNGQDLNPRALTQSVSEPVTKIFAFAVPDELKGATKYRLEYSVLLRKHIGADSRVLVRTQLFATTFGADFWCVVAPNLGVTGSWISSSEVSVIGPAQAPDGRVFYQEGFPADLHIRYSAPLQSGSTVGFHLTRGS